MQLNESNDLMARWRATGGALDARPLESVDGDDGLAAAMYSDNTPPFSCVTDDGLEAMSPTFHYCI